MKYLLTIALSLICGTAAAVDISPPAPLSCGGNAGETMTEAVVALMEGNTQRTYRTVSATATGMVTITFSKRTSSVTLNGVRLRCEFNSLTGPRTYITEFTMPPVVVPIGDTPRTVISIQASPRKITWPVVTLPPPVPITIPLPIPSSPTLVTDPKGVKATWAASPGATFYVVTWGDDGGGGNTVEPNPTTTSVVVPLKSAGWLCVQPGNSAGIQAEGMCNGYVPPVTTIGQAVLTWNAPTGVVVEGYKIYFGTTSRIYGTSVSVGNVLTYTLTGFQNGRRYYFTATSVKGSEESEYSNEVFKDMP